MNRVSTKPDPAVPHSYSKRILLAVTGLSPQVVTETVYALAVNSRPAFAPTEIRLLTTAAGKREATLNLLNETSGWFRRLLADFDLPPIVFDESCIRVVKDGAGNPMEDIRVPEHNERAADFILDAVRELTADPSCALHASIAGGRKTMGYYVGYALSLYGRPQDRLSHVLVSEPFENNHEFFYPTPYEHPIRVRRNGTEQTFDASKADVELAEIPFVRLRDGLPQALLSGKARFSEVVAQAQKSVPSPRLVLDPATCRVTAGDEVVILKPAEFAFYWMFAARARAGRPGLHWTDKGIGDELLGYYAQLKPSASGNFGRAEVAFRKNGLTKDNFDPAKSRLHRALVEALGRRRAAPYLIQRSEKIAGSRCHRQALLLPRNAITIEPSARTTAGQCRTTCSQPTSNANARRKALV